MKSTGRMGESGFYIDPWLAAALSLGLTSFQLKPAAWKCCASELSMWRTPRRVERRCCKGVSLDTPDLNPVP